MGFKYVDAEGRVLLRLFAASRDSTQNSSLVRYMLVMNPCCASLAGIGAFWVSLNMGEPLSSLFSRQPQTRAIDIAIGDATNSHYAGGNRKTVEQEPTFPFDPGILRR